MNIDADLLTAIKSGVKGYGHGLNGDYVTFNNGHIEYISYREYLLMTAAWRHGSLTG